jgi:hypothetical protein
MKMNLPPGASVAVLVDRVTPAGHSALAVIHPPVPWATGARHY